jgi:glycosyltransferase involved in cell wall biosynthesis
MTQPIRVLHVIDSLSVGGAERLLLGLAEHVDRERFEFHICAVHVLRGNKLRPRFEQLNLPVHVIGARKLADPNVLVSVARYVREHQIDIIHTHLVAADIVGRMAGRITGCPVISTLHNIPYQYNLEKGARRLLGRVTARYLTHRLVAVAKCVEQGFIEDWGIPRERISTIYNAVPMEQLLPIPVGTPPDNADHGPVITSVAGLIPSKAHANLLQAFSLVLKQRPDARLNLVGQGRLEQQLKDQAAALGIAERVNFAGVSHDIPGVLSKTDIFVLASTFEGLPLAAVEAMAAARPVVLSNVGGNPELAQDGVHGRLVPPNDVQALADALLELLNDEERRLEMGRAGRARVQHDFSMTTFTAQHEALYSSVWKERNAPKLARRASA